MYFKQSDLLWGLDKHFIQEFIETSMKETHPKGFMLFEEGDPADFFFILVKGSIRLKLGKPGRTTYLINHAGEAFGWSGLVGLQKYSTSAEFLKESMVMRFAKEFVQEITEDNPLNGMKFYRRLARMLGDRLIHSYHHETYTIPDGLNYSFGTGQDIESYTTS
jgi:CRP/FNR family cyclic AMP-dependent transcriptional regulator